MACGDPQPVRRHQSQGSRTVADRAREVLVGRGPGGARYPLHPRPARAPGDLQQPSPGPATGLQPGRTGADGRELLGNPAAPRRPGILLAHPQPAARGRRRPAARQPAALAPPRRPLALVRHPRAGLQPRPQRSRGAPDRRGQGHHLHRRGEQRAARERPTLPHAGGKHQRRDLLHRRRTQRQLRQPLGTARVRLQPGMGAAQRPPPDRHQPRASSAA